MLGIFRNLFGSKQNLVEIISRGAIILDVRTVSEYRQGHGRNSKNIPLDQLPNNIEKIKSWGKPVITCCASGMRSSSATGILKKYGIESYNAGSWQSANTLVSKSES
jgi:phage shock protein E